MPRRSSRSRNRSTHTQVFVDLDSDDSDGEECKSKRCRPSRRETVETPEISKNVLPSCGDDLLPKRSSKRIANSRRAKTNTNKLDTDIFELYMEVLWKRIDEDKKSSYAHFDSLWFNMYNSGNNKSNVLKWIKAKKIFSKKYVFVPIVCWGHWNLLVLFNFGETNYWDTKKKPRMLLLDSLKTTNPVKLRSAIKRLVVDILKTEDRQDSEQFINEVHLEFPEVPQQTGDECGIYVLFFIYCFLLNGKLGEDFSQLSKDVMFNSEELEKFQKDIDSFRANRNVLPSCKPSCDDDDHLSKEVQNTLQIAGGAKRKKTSWILIFLNCTWRIFGNE
ncbi:ubiquitin-like-specific protease 2 [Lolium rigidum]|uniref:ubiquitin-like-specific protease 2 n=1 Tax=Lolium rigidum TaxID=89674 RepID=UPI001F5E02C3|nr:ubiquitin-like-specific protease 2 [Lolium rigidum]